MKLLMQFLQPVIYPTSGLHYKLQHEAHLVYYVGTYEEHNVKYRPITRQRLGNHIPAGACARNNRTSIVRRRISKHASLITEAAFSACSVPRDDKKDIVRVS
jgi:hypothetical protein